MLRVSGKATQQGTRVRFIGLVSDSLALWSAQRHGGSLCVEKEGACQYRAFEFPLTD